MGLLDKLKGTKPAKEGVAPVSVDDLRSTLLGLNRDSAPWQVHDGADEGCDLVAEWRIVDAEWYGIFFQYGLSKVFRVKLKFDEEDHEVRNLDEQATVEWRDGVPYVSKSWSRGQINEIESGRAVGFTEEGGARPGLQLQVPLQRDQGSVARRGHRARMGLEGRVVQAVTPPDRITRSSRTTRCWPRPRTRDPTWPSGRACTSRSGRSGPARR